MTNYTLPYFGQINLAELKDYYKVKINLNQSTVSIDLNFNNNSIDQSTIETIENFLGNIENFDIKNRSHIKNDLQESGETFEYLNFLLEEFYEDEMSQIIDLDNAESSKEILLFNKLKLYRIGLYPSNKNESDYYSVFDYSIDIDGEACNQVLAVKTNKEGTLNHIAWEI
jgi:hypothetical protein